VARGESTATLHGGTGKFGTGANMAFRRSVFADIGAFDPALDVGTCTNGGGDLDMFYRVLRSGRTLVYEPRALVWHRHRRTYAELRTQLANNGVGFYSYLVRNAIQDGTERSAFVRLAVWWFWYWNVRRFLVSWLKPGKFPRDLVTAELWGSIRGLFQYPRARRRAQQLGEIAAIAPGANVATPRRVSIAERRDALVAECTAALSASETEEIARARLGVPHARRPARLAPDESASIVVATRDRPDHLRRCLESLVRQKSGRPVEIIIVDNNPASGLTAAVLREFPTVRAIAEPRPGLSYARNAGIRASRGRIIVATDDDVTMHPGWLEELVAPFADPRVKVVTGNVLPADLSTPAQRLFEAYGGLGRGTHGYRVDTDWFWAFRRAVPTWLLGATANAAFRADIFANPAIGFFDEALGAGTPAGCSEDTYLFYKVLRAGYAIVYEPRAFVWHHHRADMPSLRRQLFNYAKGHVGYQLTTLFRDGDLRALVRLCAELPRVYARRTAERLRGRSDYPLSLLAIEIAGTLAGPAAWWRSRRRAKRLGNVEATAACATIGKSLSSNARV
jgi:GT2 family glycosyltransferase